MNNETAQPAPEPLDAPLHGLEALVVKQGVGIGGLVEGQRALVLGLVWCGLPGGAMSEADVNVALKAQLGAAARCLATDHVELRRWLCDAGWVRRDAWGREYRRSSLAELPAPQQPLGEALARRFDGTDPAAWVADCRAAREAERRARREAHARPRESGAA